MNKEKFEKENVFGVELVKRETTKEKNMVMCVDSEDSWVSAKSNQKMDDLKVIYNSIRMIMQLWIKLRKHKGGFYWHSRKLKIYSKEKARKIDMSYKMRR